jgi:hypothetical protein
MRGLAEKLGRRRLIWRYDPIFLCSLTDGEFHIRNFKTLAGALRGAVDRVVFSVYDPYPAAQKRIAALERSGVFKMLPLYEPVETGGRNLPGLRGNGSPKAPAKLRPELRPQLRKLLAKLARIAGEAGITSYACAEAEDLSSLGIAAGACIDAGLVKELWGIEISGKDKNQRPHCRCAPSVDIGWYGPCPAACIYCYARKNTKPAAGNSAAAGDTPTCPE